MSKPIKLTERIYEQLLQDFMQKIASSKMSDGHFSYFYTPEEKKKKAKLFLTPTAYVKMKNLVKYFSSEVGWHATAERIADDVYRVCDVFVYPQEVTGSTVNTDQQTYEAWGQSLPEEIYNAVRFHGHSHVRFGTNPSPTDMSHRNDIVSQLGEEDFYIFAIVNKLDEWNLAIYDMRSNTFFENADITMLLEGTDESCVDFVKSCESLVKSKTDKALQSKPQPKKESKKPSKNAQLSLYVDNTKSSSTGDWLRYADRYTAYASLDEEEDWADYPSPYDKRFLE